jgi:four helix bundle protein
MEKRIQSFRDLRVYQDALALQQALFPRSQVWPAEERYSLTDQLRRSSRSVGANLAEAWAKRRYPAHFASKLSDADGEPQETSHRLTTARECGYLSVSEERELARQLSLLGARLGAMLAKPEMFCG